MGPTATGGDQSAAKSGAELEDGEMSADAGVDQDSILKSIRQRAASTITVQPAVAKRTDAVDELQHDPLQISDPYDSTSFATLQYARPLDLQNRSCSATLPDADTLDLQLDALLQDARPPAP